MCISICTLQLRVADAVRPSRNHVLYFIPIECVLSWLGGVPFENGLVSREYVREIVAFNNRLPKF